MRGRSSNSRYRFGGLSKARVRPAAKNCGGSVKKAARDDAIKVEGEKSRPRLDRPMRKSGGRVKREGGGRISEDSKRMVKSLRSEDDPPGFGNTNALKLGAGVGTALHFLKNSRMPIPVRGLATAAGMALAGKGAKDTVGDFRQMDKAAAARKEADRIEKGLVKPGEEDRKRGGRVFGKKKQRDDEDED